MKNQLQKIDNFVIFKTATAKVNIAVYLKDDTLWLTQKLICELFVKSKSTISEHLKNIFVAEELSEYAVVRKFRTTAQDGKTHKTKYDNLRAITAVGYRVNPPNA